VFIPSQFGSDVANDLLSIEFLLLIHFVDYDETVEQDNQQCNDQEYMSPLDLVVEPSMHHDSLSIYDFHYYMNLITHPLRL